MQIEWDVLRPCGTNILEMFSEQLGSSCGWNLVSWVERGRK